MVGLGREYGGDRGRRVLHAGREFGERIPALLQARLLISSTLGRDRKAVVAGG